MNTKLSQYVGLARPPAPEHSKLVLSHNTGPSVYFPEPPKFVLSHNTEPSEVIPDLRKNRHYDCDCMSCRPWTS